MKIKRDIGAKIDWLSIIIFLILIFIGWLNIYSAVYNEESTGIFDINQKYGRQLIWIIASLLVAFIILIIDSKFYSFFANIIYGFFIILLILVFLFGKELHGARSWFTFGNFLFQPSEFAKFATSLAIAKFLSTFYYRLKELKYRIRLGIIIFLPIILIIAQNDFGSALVYFSFILVLFRAGLPGKYILYMIFLMILFFISLIIDHIYIIPGLLVLFFLRYSYIIKQVKEPLISFSILTGFTLICIGINEVLNLNISIIGIILLCIGLGMIGIIIYNRRGNIGSIFRNIALLIVALFITFSVNYVYNNILEPYHRQRIDLMLGIKNDPLGAGYNINQSKIAIGSGGFSGKGYLKGTQTKYEFVPEQATDFIFCTIGEEWGFLGAGAVILLFAGLLSRLVFIAERQRSEFSRIYGYCVVSILFFHFAINMAMTIGLFPVIGIPLPFISYGGSSLLAFTLLFFIFIRMDSERHLVIV